MIERSIGQLTKMIKIENDVEKLQHIMIKGVAFDTRLIKPGNLFIPLQGEKADGHQFVDNALNKGAAAVLWQKNMPNPPKNAPVLMVEDTLLALQELASSYRNELTLKVIGITGSNGKTTTKDITAAVFSEKFNVHKTAGNFNNHIGLPYTILMMEETAEIAILEMGMSGKGEIALLTKIARPDIAIITNIGEAHLQDLGSREAIAEAKLEIVEGLAKNGLLIYPGNESLINAKLPDFTHIRTHTFGESTKNDIYPQHIHMNEDGSNFHVNIFPNESFGLPIPGSHNVMNALAAITAAYECSVQPKDIQNGLKSVKLSNMRMEWHDGIKGTRILNDAYNASPTAMKAVISMIENMDGNREKIVVLGDMLELGAAEQKFHQELGKGLNPNKIKYVFTYGPLGKFIYDGAREHFPEQRVFAFQDKKELITMLEGKINGDELVVFKASRGMKLEEVVNAMILKK